ncbi:MAG: endonuclease/exonuclease/phosphatase family protein [Bacteroidota bacterium]
MDQFVLCAILIRLFYFLLAVLTVLTYIPPWIHPDLCWPIASLGLLAPTLWLAMFFFLLYWLLRKDRRKAGASAIILILGWSMINNAFALPDGGPDPTAEDISIVSLNGHSFSLKGIKDKRAGLRAVYRFLDSLDADILLIQEFYRENKSDAMVREIIANTQFKHGFRGPRGPLVIFSRYPIKNGQDTYFANGVNGFLQADIHTPKGVLHVCNVHLQSNAISLMAHSVAESPDILEESTRQRIKMMLERYGRSNKKRVTQSQQIIDQLNTVQHPIIIGGDFNEVPTSYLYRLLGGQYQDAHLAQSWGLGTTYEGLIPGLRIDYLLVDYALPILDYEQYPCWFSDHEAIKAVLKQ